VTGRAYYPLFANLRGRRCVVVGCGPVARRKIKELLSCGADVTVICPGPARTPEAASSPGRIRHVRRRFRASDLRGAWLVCAATDDERVNDAVFRAACRRRILANVVDRTDRCTFVAPALLRRGRVVIAISTGGASPALARRLRERVGRMIDPSYGRLAAMLASLRAVAKRRLPSPERRKRYFLRVVDGRAGALARAGLRAAARRESLALLARMERGRRTPRATRSGNG